MKKQKRFSTRASVIKEIDRVRGFYNEKTIEAERLRDLATQQFKDSATASHTDAAELVKSAQFNRAQSEYMFKQSERLDKKLDILKQTLAAFDTEIMPFMRADPSVVLQK